MSGLARIPVTSRGYVVADNVGLLTGVYMCVYRIDMRAREKAYAMLCDAGEGVYKIWYE